MVEFPTFEDSWPWP